MSKNGFEFLIGWSDFPNIKYDTWEPITNSLGSEQMIALQEFPRLARMARQYLVVSATSASPERLFSSVGHVKSDENPCLYFEIKFPFRDRGPGLDKSD